ncbi:hypothetical protein Geob_3200 [Geotalea daltonii FRC-32]|uniref:Uncharacterized protein n=1 Tax=Geotalea daltonii (strain DSM 22248 / JCM 15807 / FRC-32) TaxID=316067 RepID=B9M488_GEODF|nr:hypothetical protein [Geotalea daltonii]ACM21543.1 hypothetical protein Geob_3200 [Geotalea daltonii FRC-32]
MFDLTEVKYVKRITVGTDNPGRMRTPEELDEATALLNKCLTGTPKGCIIGAEKSFAVLQMGEHQVVLQWIVYHVGFPRKPIWLDD